MAEPRHLENAPIREAIVDIRVKARPSLNAEDLSVLQSQVVDRFPKAEKQQFFTAIVKPKKGQVTTEGRYVGIVCRSADGLEVVQFRVDGFTFNRLRPYTRWKSIWPTAFGLWKMYFAVAKPEAITRMALRYINQLEPKQHHIGDVLTIPTPCPPGLDVSITKYSSKVTVRSIQLPGLAAHIAQALDQKPESAEAVLLLDIDAFQSFNLLSEDATDQKIQESFGRLHEFKNHIFFSSLSDEMIGDFE